MGTVLYHVELRVECADLARARRPEGPDLTSIDTVKAWADNEHTAVEQRTLLLNRFLLPALDVLVNAREMPEMLAKCEQSEASHAVLRLSLETP